MYVQVLVAGANPGNFPWLPGAFADRWQVQTHPGGALGASLLTCIIARRRSKKEGICKEVP